MGVTDQRLSQSLRNVQMCSSAMFRRYFSLKPPLLLSQQFSVLEKERTFCVTQPQYLRRNLRRYIFFFFVSLLLPRSALCYNVVPDVNGVHYSCSHLYHTTVISCLFKQFPDKGSSCCLVRLSPENLPFSALQSTSHDHTFEAN